MKTQIQIDHREWKEWRSHEHDGALGKLNKLLSPHGVKLDAINDRGDDFLDMVAVSGDNNDPAATRSAWDADPREILKGVGNYERFVVHAALQFCRINLNDVPPRTDLWDWLKTQRLDKRDSLSVRQRAAYWRRILKTWARKYNAEI